MTTLQHAEYQLKVIMPTARKQGCKCEFTHDHLADYMAGKWQHNPDCPAKLVECLPNVNLIKILAGR